MSLRYNGVEFVFPLTKISAGPEKDQSGTDQTFTTIRLEVDSILNIQQLPGQGNDYDAGGVFARVRHLLTAPRRPLYYDLTSLPGAVAGPGQAKILDIPDGRDDAGGPWPDPNAFSCRYVTPGTILVHWVCTVKIRDCDPANGPTANPLSLRWEDSIAFDETWKATYRRVGTLVLSSLTLNTMDWWRRKNIAPAVAPGFARTRANYVRSRDGLRCDFEFVDEQIRFAPPYPGVDMRIRQSESMPLVGSIRQGQVDVWMRGAQNASVVDLQQWTTTIAFARMWAANPLAAKGRVIGNGVFNSDESTRGVEAQFTLSYKVQPNDKRQSTITANLKAWSDQVLGPGAFIGNPPVPTQQAKDPTGAPILPWVGFGTSPPNPSNPNGFAKWADPTASLAPGPADGVGLAKSIALYAALLQDPCGLALDPTPYAVNVTEISTSVPDIFNTPAGGTGSPSRAGTGGVVNTSQLSAAVADLTPSGYPNTVNNVAADGFFRDDGQPGAYDHWQCLNEYVHDPGNLVLPTCNKDGVNIKVNANSEGYTLRRRWSACRDGAMPTVPPTDFGDPNFVFVRAYDGIPDIRTLPDGVSQRYEVKGVYEYEALDAAKVKRLAEIGPFVDRTGLGPLAGWLENAPVLDDTIIRNLGAGSGSGGGAGFPGGGGGVLGSGTLLTGPLL